MSQVAGTPPLARPQRHILRWVVVLVGLVIVAAIGYYAYMLFSMSSAPAGLNTATTRTSAQGLYRGSWVSQLDPISIDQIHTWTLHLETPDGRPLENAQVTVDGGMPQHGHGLPTQPMVTQYLGQGNYRVEGMKFQMTGWWVVNFHITSNGKSDTLQFNLMLE